MQSWVWSSNFYSPILNNLLFFGNSTLNLMETGFEKNMSKLRSMARFFVVCELGFGITASFWFDNWTALGYLIDITGKSGLRSSRLPMNVVVANGLRGNGWINSSRSCNPIITLLLQYLPPPDAIHQSESDDQYIWKIGENVPVNKFSTSATWHYLHPESHMVWIGTLWFG